MKDLIEDLKNVSDSELRELVKARHREFMVDVNIGDASYSFDEATIEEHLKNESRVELEFLYALESAEAILERAEKKRS